MTSIISIKEIFDKVSKGIVKHPEKVKKLNANFLFRIFGDQKGLYYLNFTDNLGLSFEDKPADCIFELRDKDLQRLYLGNLTGVKAVISGKLTVIGKLELATRIKDIFDSL